MSQAEIGIIGGSGLYSMPGLTKVKEVRLRTPFGAPSDAYVCGTLEGRKVGCLVADGTDGKLIASLKSAAAKAKPEEQKIQVMAPDNVKNMLVLNEQQVDKYSTTYPDRWTQLKVG